MAAFHVLALSLGFLSLLLVASSILALYRIFKFISEMGPFSVVVTIHEAPARRSTPQDAAWLEEQKQKLKDRGLWRGEERNEST